ncbi:MAG: biopolymer transporter ExbD [Bdellovibrionales bacterium]|nr:biopolymer transporter ExbD [Oligoflexia bacterium]
MQTLFNHKHKKKKASEEAALQITSMADIFTIILVFLLKTTASGISSISPNGATLPLGRAAEITKETLKVEVSKNGITVDDKSVLTLANFELPLSEVQENGMSQSVYQAFMGKRSNHQEANSQSELLVLADENTPYSTLKTVLASAANSGFVDLQLVVVQDE